MLMLIRGQHKTGGIKPKAQARLYDLVNKTSQSSLRKIECSRHKIVSLMRDMC